MPVAGLDSTWADVSDGYLHEGRSTRPFFIAAANAQYCSSAPRTRRLPAAGLISASNESSLVPASGPCMPMENPRVPQCANLHRCQFHAFHAVSLRKLLLQALTANIARLLSPNPSKPRASILYFKSIHLCKRDATLRGPGCEVVDGLSCGQRR